MIQHPFEADELMRIFEIARRALHTNIEYYESELNGDLTELDAKMQGFMNPVRKFTIDVMLVDSPGSTSAHLLAEYVTAWIQSCANSSTLVLDELITLVAEEPEKQGFQLCITATEQEADALKDDLYATFMEWIVHDPKESKGDEQPADDRGALVHECGDDYRLDQEGPAWITIQNLSVLIQKTDDGVVVKIFPVGHEDGEPITATTAYFVEGHSEQSAKAEDAFNAFYMEHVANEGQD